MRASRYTRRFTENRWLALAALGALLGTAGACGGKVLPLGPEDAASTQAAQDAAAEGGAIGTTTAPDCPGCTFPPMTAPPCTSAPSIKVVYPPDTALLPPNLGTISVQWVPYDASFVRFEVDFTQSAQAPVTDWRIVTACSSQTKDQEDAGSGGCELTVDATSWSQIAAANRGGEPVAVTVRGTTDGMCASTSEDTIHVSLAAEDVLGTYFYWRSEPALLGQSGQVWGQAFGDVATSPGQNLTSPTFGQPLCSGCHYEARDGSRMLVYPDDDTDPDYGGLAGSYVDIAQWPTGAAVALASGPASRLHGHRFGRDLVHHLERVSLPGDRVQHLPTDGVGQLSRGGAGQWVFALGWPDRHVHGSGPDGPHGYASHHAGLVGRRHVDRLRFAHGGRQLGHWPAQRRRPHLWRQSVQRALQGQRRVR